MTPVMLVRLHDSMMEAPDRKWVKTWISRFSKEVKRRADFSKAGWKFLSWLLADRKPEIAHSLRVLTEGKEVKEASARGVAWSTWKAASKTLTAESWMITHISWAVTWSHYPPAAGAWAYEASRWGSSLVPYKEQGEKLLELLKECK